MHLLLIATLFLFQNNHKPVPTQEVTSSTTQQPADNAQPSPTVHSVGHDNKESNAHHAESGDSYDPRKDCLYRWYLSFTIIGVIGGFIGIGVLIWQTTLTSENANAAKDAAIAAKTNSQAVINSERPWLFIYLPKISPNPRQAHVTISFANHGRTPAKIMWYTGEFTFDDPEKLPSVPKYQMPDRELAHKRFLAPGDEPFEIFGMDCGSAMTDEIWNNVHQKMQRVIFFGHIVYQDLIEGKEHETRYCYFLSHTPGAGLIMCGPPGWNDHT